MTVNINNIYDLLKKFVFIEKTCEIGTFFSRLLLFPRYFYNILHDIHFKEAFGYPNPNSFLDA